MTTDGPLRNEETAPTRRLVSLLALPDDSGSYLGTEGRHRWRFRPPPGEIIGYEGRTEPGDVTRGDLDGGSGCALTDLVEAIGRSFNLRQAVSGTLGDETEAGINCQTREKTNMPCGTVSLMEHNRQSNVPDHDVMHAARCRN